MQRLSIIIPAHNEEKRIGKMLEAYSEYFENLRKNRELDYEFIVVINNTTDRTENIVREFQRKNKRINYLNLLKGGKSYAVLEGFKYSLNRENELIGFVDADMATPPESFYELIKSIGTYHAAIASRSHPKSKVKTSLKRKIFSKGFNFGVRASLMMPYRDTQCGAKLFKRNVVNEIVKNPPYSQWAFDVELIYNLGKKGFLIREIPTIWSDESHSNINLKKVPVQMFSSVVRLRLVNSPFRFIVRAYDKLPSSLKGIFEEQ